MVAAVALVVYLSDMLCKVLTEQGQNKHPNIINIHSPTVNKVTSVTPILQISLSYDKVTAIYS